MANGGFPGIMFDPATGQYVANGAPLGTSLPGQYPPLPDTDPSQSGGFQVGQAGTGYGGDYDPTQDAPQYAPNTPSWQQTGGGTTGAGAGPQDPASDAGGSGGALAGQPSGALSGQPGGFLNTLLGSGQQWNNFLQNGGWQTMGALGGALLQGRGNIGNSMAIFGQEVPQLAEQGQQRMALNNLLKSRSFGTNLPPETQQFLNSPQGQAYLRANPQVAQGLATWALTPRAPITVQPGASLYDPVTHQWITGGANQRGGGSNYDLEEAKKVYESQYGSAGNVAIDAPDFQWWYRNAWPNYGTGQGITTGRPVTMTPDENQPAQPQQQPPRRSYTEQDLSRFDRASMLPMLI